MKRTRTTATALGLLAICWPCWGCPLKGDRSDEWGVAAEPVLHEVCVDPGAGFPQVLAETVVFSDGIPSSATLRAKVCSDHPGLAVFAIGPGERVHLDQEFDLVEALPRERVGNDLRARIVFEATAPFDEAIVEMAFYARTDETSFDERKVTILLRCVTQNGDDEDEVGNEGLLFASDADGDFEIYRADLLGGDQVGLPDPLTSDDATDRHPAWSPDGTEIAFVSDRHAPGGGVSRLYFLDVTQPGSAPVPANIVSLNGGSVGEWDPDISEPAFSVDDGGRRVAFVGRLGASIATLYVLDRDTGDVAAGQGSLVDDLDSPTWNGGQLVWGFEGILRRRDASGTDMDAFMSGAGDRHPSWCADGSCCLFASAASGADRIWRVDGSFMNPLQLTAGAGFSDSQPTAPRDGSQLLWVRLDDGGGFEQVFRTDPDGSNAAPLALPPPFDAARVLDPDAR